MNTCRRLIAACFCLLALMPTLVQAAMTAEVDRTRLNVGETVELRIRIEGNQRTEPDFAPLLEHFDILSRSQSSQTRIINWKREQFREWTLVLAPKRTGIVVIPPLSAGGESSQPITLRVAASGTSAGESLPAVFVETHTEPETAYVQSQVILVVKVLHRYQLEGNLTEPEIPGAVVEKLGEQRSYGEVREGVRFQVTERRYALFPQASGTLRIPELVLTGTLHRQVQGFGFNPFGPIQNGSTIRLRSEPAELEVLPRPDKWPAGQAWLPAQKFSLQAQWTPENREARAGEPLVLQITTEATGLSATQLPAPVIDWPAGLQVYPDKAVQDNQMDGNGVTGTRVDRYTVIPARGGEFRIPAIEVPWWNITEQRRETARVPAARLQVSGTLARPHTGADTDADHGTTAPSAIVAPTTAPERQQSILPWLLAGLFAIGWGVTAFFWLRERHAGQTASVGNAGPVSSPDPYWYHVARACRNADPGASYTAVLNWLRELPPEQAAEIRAALHGEKANPDLAGNWQQLERGLYRESGTSSFDGTQFFQALNAERKALLKRNRNKPAKLPGLYPQHPEASHS